MPQQLIYTSAPQGVGVGRSGYCTVARSSTMGESLVQRLEQFSYYERLSEHGGEAERTVFIFRNIDIRGKAYHVLSHIKDAAADYTGRTNFIAHHLVFTPDEVANMPTPAVLLNHWSGWKDDWEQEPTLFENESWAELEELNKPTYLPAKHWLRETGDAGRAAGLLGLNTGVFTAHDFKPKLILNLLSESLELLQLVGPNWRFLAWQRTFSVGCQPQDNPADFSWRFLTSGLPFEASLSQGRTPLELRGLRAPSNSQQQQFAQKGPSRPQFTRLPRAGEALQLNEGETLILDGEAQSLPGPIIYRWYRVEKDNVTLQEIDGAHGAKLEITKSQRGKHRYKVEAWDSVTHQYDVSPLLVVEVKEKVEISSRSRTPASTADRALPSSQGQKNNDRKKSGSSLTINRQKQNTPIFDSKEDDIESTTFWVRNKTAILSLACLSLVVAISYMLLSHYDFWKPWFSGLDGKKDWWHAKMLRNPEFFKNHQRITPSTDQLITDFLNSKSVQKKEVVIQRITGDLEALDNQKREARKQQDKLGQGSSTNNVKNPVEPKELKKDSPPPASTPPKKADAAPLGEAPTKIAFQSKIYPILASNSWEVISSPIEIKFRTLLENKKQKTKDLEKVTTVPSRPNPKQLENATNHLVQAEREIKDYTKENTLWDVLQKQKIQAMSIVYPTWMLFKPTNAPALTLHWGLLGNTDPESNAVNGVYQTNNYSFLNDTWSLQIYSTGAVYSLTQKGLNSKSGPIRADISMSENTDGVNEPLRLLLFKHDDSSKAFLAEVDGDFLKPSAKFQEFLNNLDVKKTQLRIHCGYDNLTPQNFGVSDQNGSWKLGITEKLIAATRKSETLESIKNALNRLETFWNLVKKSNQIYLKEKSFAEAVSDRKDPKEAFWKNLNQLCVVAIYQRTWDARKPDLENKIGEEPWKKIKDFMDDKEGDKKYETELKQLTEDLKHFKEFWLEPSSKKPYSEAKNALENEIKDLKVQGTQIVPAKLQVYLQFNAWKTNWLTITKLDCQ